MSFSTEMMMRFLALVDAVRKSFPADDFFSDFEASCLADSFKRKHYQLYEDALACLDEESWEILREKTIAHFCSERQGQRKQPFFNQLNEAFAYKYLRELGHREIAFIRERKSRTPDIRYLDEGITKHCEVKTIAISDREIADRSSGQVRDMSVYLSLGTGFVNKLKDDVGRAWEQVCALGQDGLVFILIRFDDLALDHVDKYHAQLAAFCGEQQRQNLVLMTFAGSKLVPIVR